MKQQDVVIHDESVSERNPFGVQLEEPMQHQMAIGKYAPKPFRPGDNGGYGIPTIP